MLTYFSSFFFLLLQCRTAHTGQHHPALTEADRLIKVKLTLPHWRQIRTCLTIAHISSSINSNCGNCGRSINYHRQAVCHCLSHCAYYQSGTTPSLSASLTVSSSTSSSSSSSVPSVFSNFCSLLFANQSSIKHGAFVITMINVPLFSRAAHSLCVHHHHHWFHCSCCCC